MSDHAESSRPCAFTAPYLTHHEDEAEDLRRAGEVLYHDRTHTPPRRQLPGRGARRRLRALAGELSSLAEWLAAFDALALECLEVGEEGAGRFCAVMGNVGRHLSALEAVLRAAEDHGEGNGRAWGLTRSPGPVGVFQDWLGSMAAVMRRWAPETRRLAEAMVPVLPDEKTRRLMDLEDEETLPVALFHFLDTIQGDFLARCIADLERLAAARERIPKVHEVPDDAPRVHREIDADAFKEEQ